MEHAWGNEKYIQPVGRETAKEKATKETKLKMIE
jgi:hypothetical protein